MKKINTRNILFIAVFVLLLLLSGNETWCQNNLALAGTATASSTEGSNTSDKAIDGNKETSWISDVGGKNKWLTVVLPGATEIKKVQASMETSSGDPIPYFAIQTFLNGSWRNQVNHTDNDQKEITLTFEKAILTDRIRLSINVDDVVIVSEFGIHGHQYVDSTATEVKKILVNQSGYNLEKPKRFTAPEVSDNTPFTIKNTSSGEEVYHGVVQNNIGDFTLFNPTTGDEYVVAIDTFTSYPFRIAPFWLEHVSYRNMIDFMIGARHYTGTSDKIRSLSWAWRDGDFFNWALQSMIALYLSNPEAYKRMEKKVSYVSNSSFPSEYEGKWGKLEPYDKNAPDIVKLIHWDVDVKISQELEHEHQKAELAHFLYAFPYFKQWLPQQNFDIVYEYLKNKWTKKVVSKKSTTQYDKSPEHNLLMLKTKMGTNKGELPPGHSVIPNLMMYEVAKKQNEADADKYFDAAYSQIEWMITNLDWKDPLTTKGQRMSEHITMRAFAYFYHQYQEKAPEGLYEKVLDWAKVMISRSDNMWDFRKYTDSGDWVPAGWNETGNILGFPACALAAASVINDKDLKNRLNQLVWSHFDDAFGRNPTGRHFSYDGPSEIEGVDLGWYSYHHGGIGLLEPVRFVFDGSPKTNHYPNHPEIGNLGWTEGWVQFNTAYNISMAYLAHSDTEIELKNTKKKILTVRLKTPLNFDPKEIDKLEIKATSSSGDSATITLKEESPYSKYLIGNIEYRGGKINTKDEVLQLKKGDEVSVSYGLGYFEKKASMVVKR
ncbi:discoidin domain-containing protein [Fulvivirgaceae bacterium BMA10]|uniref:Discoidin domain-containing protein n=1 Tax=Splendidivirga corallicola TaxID=3051826 RepID=A0ABT8KJ73_9BACT|nr:discoidin domain-containing protein [Fulvivirgaceae bacterium BMA10]